MIRQKGEDIDKDDEKNVRFYYYDTEKVENTIQEKHNQSVSLRSMMAINKESSVSSVIKSF
jgi:hypothetical protein